MLGGRESVDPYEDLVVRARGDLDAGRTATAAIGLSAALEALLALDGGDADLTAAARQAREARDAALSGAAPASADVEQPLRVAETAMRRRALR